MAASFITGMVIGHALSGRPEPADFPAPMPTMCVIAENYEEYRLCRWPELADQFYQSRRLHCGSQDNPVPKECDLNWRTGMEWRGLLRARGITPK